jgi:hypothetical protein
MNMGEAIELDSDKGFRTVLEPRVENCEKKLVVSGA